MATFKEYKKFVPFSDNKIMIALVLTMNITIYYSYCFDPIATRHLKNSESDLGVPTLANWTEMS